MKMEWGQESLRSLYELHAHGKGVIPFVGAGMSVAFGLPTWKQFLELCAMSLTVESRSSVTEMIAANEFEKAAESLRKLPGFEERIRTTFGASIQRIRTGKAIEWLPRVWRRSVVVTTNYDRILEWVYDESCLPFQWTSYNPLGRNYSQAYERREHCLIKLHGDVAHSTSRILTLDDYEKHYSHSEIVPDALERLFSTESILFIGCSLLKDRYLDILKDLRAYPTRFAILPADGEERRLDELGIRPIWYPSGDHGVIELILKYLFDGQQPAPDGKLTLSLALRVADEFDVFDYIRKDPALIQETSFAPLLDELPVRSFVLSRPDRSNLVLTTWPHLQIEDRTLPPSPAVSLLDLRESLHFDYKISRPRSVRLAITPGMPVRVVLECRETGESIVVEVDAVDSPLTRIAMNGNRVSKI